MTTLHPCLPETFVVEVNPQTSEGYTKTPVLGWVFEDGRPLPMTLHGKHALIGGDTAVMFPGGMVEHPSDGLAFETVEHWLESNPGKRGSAGHEKAVKANAPASKPSAPAEAESAYDIEFSDDSYKSNSWWHYDDDEHEFLFQVDGGENIPKATTKVVKIKRDDFHRLKKDLDVLTLAEIADADPLPVTDDFEDDEGDDDADDLI